jgi:hypothetical protein
MLALKLALHSLHPFETFRPPVTPLDTLANWELIIGCALFILFTLFYGLRFRWYKTLDDRVNWAGIGIFSVFLAISALLIFSVAVRLLTTGDYLFRDLYRVIVYFMLPASGVLMFVALFKSREQLLRELRAGSKHSAHSPETPVDDYKA